MRMPPSGARTEVAVNPSPFQRLDAEARHLLWLAAALVGIVAVVPPIVFFVLALGNLRSETERNANHLISLIVSSVSASHLDIQHLSGLIQEEMAFNNLSRVRLLGADDHEILRIGESFSFGVTEVVIGLPPSTGPARKLRVEAREGLIFGNAARVMGIHLLVAAVLSLIVYGVPMRALQHAIK